MSEPFKITYDESESKNRIYPEEVPFVIQSETETSYLVICYNNKYMYVNLQDGSIPIDSYDTLEEMFDHNPTDKVVEVELKIKGEWKG